MSTQDIAPIAAAVAALGSWAAVIQAGRLARRATSPVLYLQTIYNPAMSCFGAVVLNAGDGAARGVQYMIADETRSFKAHSGTAYFVRASPCKLFAPCRRCPKPRSSGW